MHAQYVAQLQEFESLQEQIWAWQLTNFGVSPISHPLLGMCEEAGELVHAVLKMSQGIRGSESDHADAIKDALGDILIYLIDFFRRCQLGFVHPLCEFFLYPPSFQTHTMQDLEALALHVYLAVANLCTAAEKVFYVDQPLLKSYHIEVKECTAIVLQDVQGVAGVLGFPAYHCLTDTWEKVVSKRDWKVNPQSGQVAGASELP